MLTSYSFDKLANRGFRVIFKNVSLQIRSLRLVQSEITFSSFHRVLGKLRESQMSPKIRNHRRQWRLEEAFHFASSNFKIADLNDYQKLAIRRAVVKKDDIFVNLPTGSGKSLIYQQNGADWQTRLLRFLAIVDLPFSFRFPDRLFWLVASIAFLKDTSCCVIRGFLS